ncbi:hypothetical protein BD779DRAFT_959620 [Infundibulicybe gibba]|nr:hypothetical protein BD779DRAFT_959620 [Infundibulicybe gibba]
MDEHKIWREKCAEKQTMLDEMQDLLDARNREFDALSERAAATEESIIRAEIRAEDAEAELHRALKHVADVQEHCGDVEQEKQELMLRLKRQTEQFEILTDQQQRAVMPECDHTPVLSKATHRISFASRYLREDKPATALHWLDEAHRELSDHLERELLSRVSTTSSHESDGYGSQSPEGRVQSVSSKRRDRDSSEELEDSPLKKLRGAIW